MKRFSVLIFTCCAMIASTSDAAQNVPSLADAIAAADPGQVEELQNELPAMSLSTSSNGINVETVVLSGLDRSQFNADEIADIEALLSVINANAEYFRFNIAAVIRDAIDSGDSTVADQAALMREFALLSPEGKARIGGDINFPHENLDGTTNLDGFTDADKEIICATDGITC